MESWRLVWRNGFAPDLSTKGLLALLHGLDTDDRRLVQGSTTTPPPLMCAQDWPVEAADAIAYTYWIGDRDGEATVGEAEEFFAKACFAADQRLGEPAACRWFLNWYDDTPRGEMMTELAEEVREILRSRGVVPPEKIVYRPLPEGFCVALDENDEPDYTLLGVIADWWQENGEEAAAEAVRWLIRKRRKLQQSGGWHREESGDSSTLHDLPRTLYDQVPSNYSVTSPTLALYLLVRRWLLSSAAERVKYWAWEPKGVPA